MIGNAATTFLSLENARRAAVCLSFDCFALFVIFYPSSVH